MELGGYVLFGQLACCKKHRKSTAGQHRRMYTHSFFFAGVAILWCRPVYRLWLVPEQHKNLLKIRPYRFKRQLTTSHYSIFFPPLTCVHFRFAGNGRVGPHLQLLDLQLPIDGVQGKGQGRTTNASQ